MELTLEPFTFTQKKIINIETAFMQCFIVALALGDDEICCFKQFPCFLADMRKPGAADIIAIADDSGNLCKPDLLGIFHCRIVDSRETADDHSDGKLRIEFFQQFDDKLIKYNFTTVICQVNKPGGRGEFFAEAAVLIFVKWILIFFIKKREDSGRIHICKCGKINIVADTCIEKCRFQRIVRVPDRFLKRWFQI